MKQTMRFLSIAVLVAVGAMFLSCSKTEIDTEPQQEDNIITLTTTVSFDNGTETRALTGTGAKTFAENETMAIVYKETSGYTAMAVSAPLESTDIAEGGKSATFSFALTSPDKKKDVTYIYPAAMAKPNFTVNYAALATQDGTLDNLAGNLDLATYTGAWNGASLPTGMLENQLAILALTLKDSYDDSDLNSTITGVTLSDGTNSYSVTRSAAAGPIYVAIKPTSSAAISVTATAGTTYYKKKLTGKTYAASNGYSLSWRMMKAIPLASITSPADLGKVIGADGYAYYTATAATAAGTTASGIIAYVGSAGSVDESSGAYKGLAIALTDASNGSTFQWHDYTDGAAYCSSHTTDVGDAIDYKNGIANTTKLTNGNSSHTHAAATAAKNYSTARPSGVSAWFLPSMGQWNLIVQGLATKKSGSTVSTNLTTSENSTYKSPNLNSVITDAGGTWLKFGNYWSTTEYNGYYTWTMDFSSGEAWSDCVKTKGYFVRPVFAF